MRNTRKNILLEAKADLELGVVKALSFSPLRPEELHELLAITEADLMRDHGCDLYMAEQVKQHAKKEQYRLRAQNQFAPTEDTQDLYPKKPYTRTSPINETLEAGRMLDYGQVASDSREGRMAKGALRNIAGDAYRLHQLLDDEDDLPQWCEYKIAQAKLMMNSVREYIEYKLERHSEDLPGEAEIYMADEPGEGFDV
tara:strand:+ start:1040 stop:1633 length:594 start_codon:yes stop_codon:yes gene_type:complete